MHLPPKGQNIHHLPTYFGYHTSGERHYYAQSYQHIHVGHLRFNSRQLGDYLNHLQCVAH